MSNQSTSERAATTIPSGEGRSIRKSSAPTRCGLLRRAVSDRRDQLHVLSHADREAVKGWAAGRRTTSRFTLKAPKRITHDAKLQRCEDNLQAFCRSAATLGPKLGACCFSSRRISRRTRRLEAFLGAAPEGIRAAFEFRHASWLDAEVFDALRSRNVALCIADSEKLSTPVETTADYGYFRLRDEGYQRPTSRSGRRVKQLPPDDFVYFKHEEQGLGPDFAKRFIAAL